MSRSINRLFSRRYSVLAAPTVVGLMAVTQTVAVPLVVTTGFGNGADSFVHLQNPNSNFGNGTEVVIKDNAASTGTRKGYLRFDLSGGGDAYLGTSLDLTVTTNNQGGGGTTPQNHTVNVWGLRDGNAGESWGETTITMNNAPGSVTTNNLMTTGAVFLGQYSVPATAIGGVNSFSAPALDIFLSQDTNNNATIMLQRTGGTSGHNLGYASDEHATLAAPTLSADSINAKVLNITTNQGVGADAYVESGTGASTNFGNSAGLVVKGAGANTTRKAYTRFDLADVDGGTILGAGLMFDVSTNNGGGAGPGPSQDFTVEIFGLLDGDAGELWNESTINFNNAPANTSGNNLLANATLLGSFLVPNSEVGYSVLFSNQAIVDFLNADTNGAATFIIRRQDSNSSANLAFASGESTAFGPPTLTLIVDPVIPEPATAMLGVLGLSALALRRRRAIA